MKACGQTLATLIGRGNLLMEFPDVVDARQLPPKTSQREKMSKQFGSLNYLHATIAAEIST